MPVPEQAKEVHVSKRKWRDLSGKKQRTVLLLASIQLALAATAWADLASRPADQVNGRKGTWAALIGVNFIGPLAYFRWGRIRTRSNEH
jgi:hypothetical protein